MILRAVTYVVGGLVALMLAAGPASADSLVIPALGVRAPIVEVGQRDGAQEAPANLWRAYHWRAGVKPCAPGSTVLAGHNYEVPGGQALFRHLDDLKRGSEVRIVRPGPDCTYRTGRPFKVGINANVAFMYDWDGPARGYLATCVDRTGPGTYRNRLLVPMRLMEKR